VAAGAGAAAAGAVAVSSDDEVAGICAAAAAAAAAAAVDHPEPEPAPELSLSLESLSWTTPEGRSRMRPFYSHADEHTPEAGGPQQTEQGRKEQLFLHGVNIAVQRAAAPLLLELSAETLHRERELTRQQKAVAVLKMARPEPVRRHDQLEPRSAVAAGSAGSLDATGRASPTRTSAQRSTCDPQLLSKLLLQSRRSKEREREKEATARVRRPQSAAQRPRSARRRHHRPTSAPASRRSEPWLTAAVGAPSRVRVAVQV
jgi:hypothetical protein